MGKRIFGALVAAVALCGASAASSATFSFTASGNYDDYSAFAPFIPAGTYKVTWNSTFPLDADPFSLTLNDGYIYTFNMFFADGTYYGGDDDYGAFYYNLSPASGSDPYSVSQTITVPALPKGGTFLLDPQGDYEVDIYSPQGTELDFNPDVSVTSGQFTFTVTSVPEPTTWMLTLAGLGLIGGSLRTRRGSPILAET
jgi:hypothetical protein